MQTSVIIETYTFAHLLLYIKRYYFVPKRSRAEWSQRINLANLQFIRRTRMCVKKIRISLEGVIFIGRAILA